MVIAQPGDSGNRVEQAEAIGFLLGTALRDAPAPAMGDDLPPRAPMQHALRTALEQANDELDDDARSVLRDELRFQQLFRFEDLPMASGCLVLHRAGSDERHPTHRFVPASDCPMPRWHSAAEVALDVLWDDADGLRRHESSTAEPDLDAYAAFLAGLDRSVALTPIERGASSVLLRLACAQRTLQLEPCGRARPDPDDRAHSNDVRAAWLSRLQRLQALSATLPRLWPGAA